MRRKNIVLILIGSAILSFGLCHVHTYSDITEGGVLGATLLIEHYLKISPAVSSLILNAICFFMGYRELGKPFLKYSAVACISFSVFYAVFEKLPPLLGFLSDKPLLSAIVGGIFVGVGVGLSVLGGGASSGDDALAMSLSHRFRVDIRVVYLVSDLIVLGLSFTYLPWSRVLYSLLSVILSGQIVGLIQKLEKKSV